MGLILAVTVHAASIQNYDGELQVLAVLNGFESDFAVSR
jgi:hypothetical protein